ncbi:glutamate-cysteine ligase family protein [Amycolatopsis sp. BJA-103]|uniref:glutamate-cysteine ligase family protein n=1 Tax=Amycolatopsis sp. BJA-103 TaxID=1911175 RepID=UPI000C7946C4|nr:glutamate-cysteine ligase family protein [Amycolatopsis sp. BJA-103]AUI58724.1 ergothioneine biosynthesis glutamate--cysteine ligase EgtA [Amycolatopsis sp. BJA-103]PNE16773.1 ergothioneine biosynthesis glutamate--cysteine ligase EgtA [Amycolatopsis sp. BJA-103]
MTTVHDFPEKSGSASNATAKVLSDRAEGEAYVASVCFKHGPPRLLGVELEFTVHYADEPARPLDPDDLATALGPHTPRTLRPDSPALPLPAGSPLSLEPGCQVEISAQPQTTLRHLDAVVSADLAHLESLLSAQGLYLGDTGIDGHRAPVRKLGTPRYAAMERRFAPMGDGGATMMCNTAGLQICVDAGKVDDLPLRWAAVHALGPPLLATFANSRIHAGRDTGHASARWLAVMNTERARTRSAESERDPAGDWARRILDTPLMVLPRQDGSWDAPPALTFADWIEGRETGLGRPTEDDLAYHLTTMFTPVRPQGYLEIRYLDAQPAARWLHPVALLTALLARPSTVDKVLGLCEPVVGRWERAARFGLADRAIAAVASEVVDLGCAELGMTGLPPETISEISEGVQSLVHGSRSHQS